MLDFKNHGRDSGLEVRFICFIIIVVEIPSESRGRRSLVDTNGSLTPSDLKESSLTNGSQTYFLW